jgi:hypothetical protein
MLFPWDWPGALEDAYQAAFELLMSVLAFSLNFDNLKIVQVLFSEGYGLGTALALVVAVIIVPIGILFTRFRLSAALALVIVVMSAAIGTMWFVAMQYVGTVGDSLTLGALYISEIPIVDGDPLLTLPNFTFGNVILNAAIFAALFLWILTLAILFIGYEIVGIVLVVIGIVTLYLYGLGPRSRRFFSVIVSLLIVTQMVGRPVAIATISMINVVGRLAPTNDLVSKGIFTFIGVSLALISQIILFFVAYKTTGYVIGRLNGTVKGFMRSRQEGRSKVDATLTSGNRTPITNRSKSLDTDSAKRYRKAEITRASTATAASALTAFSVRAAKVAAAAGSKVHPALAAAALIGPPVIRAIGNVRANNQSTKPKKRGLSDYR